MGTVKAVLSITGVSKEERITTKIFIQTLISWINNNNQTKRLIRFELRDTDDYLISPLLPNKYDHNNYDSYYHNGFKYELEPGVYFITMEFADGKPGQLFHGRKWMIRAVQSTIEKEHDRRARYYSSNRWKFRNLTLPLTV